MRPDDSAVKSVESCNSSKPGDGTDLDILSNPQVGSSPININPAIDDSVTSFPEIVQLRIAPTAPDGGTSAVHGSLFLCPRGCRRSAPAHVVTAMTLHIRYRTTQLGAGALLVLGAALPHARAQAPRATVRGRVIDKASASGIPSADIVA